MTRAFDAALRQIEQLGGQTIDVPVHLARAAAGVCLPVDVGDAGAIHVPELTTRAADYGRHTKLYLLWGLCMSNAAYQDGLRVRAQVRDQLLDHLTSKVDVLILPTVGFQTPRVLEQTPGLEFLHGKRSRSTRRSSTTRGCQRSRCRAGFDDDHMPIGLQIAGKPFDEQTIVQVGLRVRAGGRLVQAAPRYLTARGRTSERRSIAVIRRSNEPPRSAVRR